MPDKIIRPERRRIERRPGRLANPNEAVAEQGWEERRTHCWDLESTCSEERRKRCSAHFVRRNCWDLWAAEYFPQGRKPCCHPDLDCSNCAVASTKFGESVAVYVALPIRSGPQAVSAVRDRAAKYCDYLHSPKENGQAKGEGEVRPSFRCQRRPGIQLHSSYVSEVCSLPEHRDCPFYEAD
jgi:hypothetical protein